MKALLLLAATGVGAVLLTSRGSDAVEAAPHEVSRGQGGSIGPAEDDATNDAPPDRPATANGQRVDGPSDLSGRPGSDTLGAFAPRTPIGTVGGAIDAAEDPAEVTTVAVDRAQVRRWLRALHSDDERWNATHAAYRLWDCLEEPAARRLIRSEAEPLLSADDDQQRTMVVSLLLALDVHAGPGPELRSPHPELARRAMERLGSCPSLGFQSALNPRVSVATRFALLHVRTLEPALGEVVGTPGHPAQFRAAFVLGHAGRTAWAPVVADTLIPHLVDNNIPDDAVMSMLALKRLGFSGLPHIQAALPAEDAQQDLCLRAILMEIRSPGSSRDLDQNGISDRVLSPAADWTY